MTKREIRSNADQPKVSDDGKTIEGYAAVFNSYSLDLGGFVEIIRPGAFDRSLAAGADVRALIDHDSSKVLGRNKAGTLALTVDDRGLKYVIQPPDRTDARDLLVSMKRGDINNSSFAFCVAMNGDNWSKDSNGRIVRELLDVDLFDVSVVTYPAYEATDASVRGLKAFNEKAASELAKRSTDTLRRRLLLREKSVS